MRVSVRVRVWGVGGGGLCAIVCLPGPQPVDMDAELSKLEASYGKGNVSEADLLSHIMYPQVRVCSHTRYVRGVQLGLCLTPHALTFRSGPWNVGQGCILASA